MEEKQIILFALLTMWTILNYTWSLHINKKAGKNEGTVETLAKLLAQTVQTAKSNLHEEVKETPIIQAEDLCKVENSEYSGYLHVFMRNKRKHERPVMQYTFNGKLVYFEYDETGKKINLNGPSRAILEKTMVGEKTKYFKKYELK